MSVIVKICGNRTVDDLVAAAEAGADLLGIIFADAWRRVPVDAAQEMVAELRRRIDSPPLIVGVFVDQPLNEVTAISDAVGLDMVQLHGDEGPDYWEQLQRPLIVGYRITPGTLLSDAEADLSSTMDYAAAHDSLVLIEPHVRGQLGGAGVGLDLSLAAQLARHHAFLLAGGLDPDNVAQAIRAVHPLGVDVSSGVESDRRKDYRKVGRFIHEARRVANSLQV